MQHISWKVAQIKHRKNFFAVNTSHALLILNYISQISSSATVCRAKLISVIKSAYREIYSSPRTTARPEPQAPADEIQYSWSSDRKIIERVDYKVCSLNLRRVYWIMFYEQLNNFVGTNFTAFWCNFIRVFGNSEYKTLEVLQKIRNNLNARNLHHLTRNKRKLHRLQHDTMRYDHWRNLCSRKHELCNPIRCYH